MGVESLEGRQLLTGGAGSTFAIVPGNITKAGGSATFSFTIDPTHFTMPKSGRMLLGVDIATESGATVRPVISAVTDVQGQPVRGLMHSHYAPGVPRSNTSKGNMTSAVLVPVSFAAGNKAETYTVTVKAQNNTSGNYLLGFYVPGDVNDEGSVTQGDLAAVQQAVGTTAAASNYNFDADANRDGAITRTDVTIVRQNLGAKTTINPTVSANLDPASDTGLQDRVTSLRTVHFTGSATPGATVTITDTNNSEPAVSTTADSSGNYSIMVNLGDGSNVFNVSTHDAFGQNISGSIAAVTYDVNAPSSLISVAPTTGTSSTQ
jgi:hypothetical protein